MDLYKSFDSFCKSLLVANLDFLVFIAKNIISKPQLWKINNKRNHVADDSSANIGIILDTINYLWKKMLKVDFMKSWTYWV